MSLLDAMLVRHVESDDKVGLEYIFFDCIVERYSIKDNMQVLKGSRRSCLISRRSIGKRREDF
jgi:hypothetical protein